MTQEHTHDVNDRPLLAGLMALDADIVATTGGEPGSGVYGLLNLLAGQFMGVKRTAMPPPAPPREVEGRKVVETEHERRERERLETAKHEPAKPHAPVPASNRR
jgi:hypothetical protein